MESRRCARLLLHGVIVVLLGLLAGFPWAMVLAEDLQGEVRAWRMAHLEGILNGLLMMAAAAAGPVLVLSKRQARWLVQSFLLAGYGNVVASLVAAGFAVRGLAPAGPAANLVVYTLFMVAVLAVLIALGLLVVGARQASRA